MPDSYRFELSEDRDNGILPAETVFYHDLLASNRMRAVVGSWRETTQGDRVIVTCTLAKAGTMSSIRSAVKGLRRFMNMALEYAGDNSSVYSVWFRWQTTGESAKRALVLGYSLEPLDHEVDDIHLESGAGRYLFSFTRAAAYEEPDSETATTTDVSASGGGWWPSTITVGDIPGRIVALRVSPRGITNDLYKMWVGWRPLRHGLDGFDPALDFNTTNSLGVTGVTNNTSEAANTLNGQYMRDDFSGGEDMAFKFSSNFDHVQSYQIKEFIGSYIVLLRCKIVSGSGVCQARVSSSFASPDYAKPIALGATQYITNTEWRLIEMGEIELPGGRVHNMIDIQSLRVNLETGRVSGTAVLGVDALILIPSKHFVTWNQATFGNSANPDTAAWIITHPDNSVGGYVAGSPVGSADKEVRTYDFAEIGGRNWAFPITYAGTGAVGGQLIIAAERETVHDITDSVGIIVEVRPRWQSYNIF